MSNSFDLAPMHQVWAWDETAGIDVSLGLDSELCFTVFSTRYAIFANAIGRWEAATLQEAVNAALAAIEEIRK